MRWVLIVLLGFEAPMPSLDGAVTTGSSDADASQVAAVANVPDRVSTVGNGDGGAHALTDGTVSQLNQRMPADAGLTIDGPAALRARLIAGRTPLTLEHLTPESGCTPTDCILQVDGLSILPGKRVLRRSTGEPIRLLEHRRPGSPALPDMDWTPIQAFAVSNEGRRWGSCLEFSHEGIGRSGSFQRWTSIVLVPLITDKQAALMLDGTVSQQDVALAQKCPQKIHRVSQQPN